MNKAMPEDMTPASQTGLPRPAECDRPKGNVRALARQHSAAALARLVELTYDPNSCVAVEDGIEAVRNLLPRCWFDAEKCRQGLRALKSYHRDYNDKRQAYLPHPAHDWSSHGSDAFRTGAVTVRETRSGAKTARRNYRRSGTFMSG